MTDQKIDRRKLTFSQAEGIDPFPQSAALGELPKKARNALWTCIYESLKRSSTPPAEGPSSYRRVLNSWRSILYEYHVYYLDEPADEFSDLLDKQIQEMKDLFLHGAYNKIFDFLQIAMRYRERSGGLFYSKGWAIPFYKVVASVLEECMCAYTVIDDEVPTIVPIALPEQKESIEAAFTVLKSGPFDGAREHLRKSAQCMNSNDLPGSVRESIHAVESVARRLDSGAATTLQPALTALSKNNVALHPAFKIGIEKLYAYTNDEEGIRHALVDGDANVDTEDAVFMFGACASFSAYLVNKARKAGLPINE